MKIIGLGRETGSELGEKGSAPSATRTRDLLLRRHKRLSAVQTCEDAGRLRANQPKAVAL
jgi:hypothetical protein